MITLKKIFSPLLHLSLCAAAFAGPPSADQQGLYTGKCKTTYYHLDTKKPEKVTGSAQVIVSADGSVSLDLPSNIGVNVYFSGNGNFGPSYGVYRDANDNDARFQIKGSGSKVSIQMTGRYVHNSAPHIVEFSARLKKVP